nr:YcaO-like family protein [Streptomyces cadmiisoli]
MYVTPDRLTSIDLRSFKSDTEVTNSGHARSFAETWEFIKPMLSKIPITRIYDASPIDFLNIPVWQAVTPLAKDLTVHGGKGATKDAAKLSAAMEAVERTSAETLPSWRIVRGSFRELASSGAVDPMRFNLPVDTSYRDDAPFSWTGAYDLISKDYFLVPTDLVINPTMEGIVPRIETNGLASGNTYSEATLHALCELIERDAEAKEDFYTAHHDPAFSPRRPIKNIDIDTITVARSLIDRLREEGLDLRVQDVTSEIQVPTFRALILDHHFFGREGALTVFPGMGCELDPARAVIRAITEACQSHSAFSTGAREAFDGVLHEDRPAVWKRLRSLYDKPGVMPFPQAESGSSADNILANLCTVVNRLRAAGIDQCLVSEVTREDLGIPVVRVIVPGLAFPFGVSSRTPTLRMLESVI